MQSPLLVSIFALGTLLLATGCSPCGNTTVTISSITGTVTYDGVAASRTNEDIGAFDSSIDLSWEDSHGDRSVDFTFDPSAPLTSGKFDLASLNAEVCTLDARSSAICVPATGTLRVVLFEVEHCGGGDAVDDIGCPTHLEADLELSAQAEAMIQMKLHLHEDGKLVPYRGCLGDRFTK